MTVVKSEIVLTKCMEFSTNLISVMGFSTRPMVWASKTLFGPVKLPHFYTSYNIQFFQEWEFGPENSETQFQRL